MMGALLKKYFLYPFFLCVTCTSFSQVSLKDKLKEAKELQENDHVVSARILLNEILSYDSTNYEAVFLRGVGYYKMLNLPKALIDFNSLIDQKIFLSEALYYRSSVYMRMEDYNGVLKDCNSLLELEPLNRNAKLMRLSSLLALENYEQGFSESNDFVKTYPKVGEGYTIRAAFRMLNKGRYIDICSDILMSNYLGVRQLKELDVHKCFYDDFPFKVGECMERECLSPLVVNFKMISAQPVSEEMIIGKWEQMASLMTWEDTLTGIVNSTFLLGVHEVDYSRIFTFESNNKGICDFNSEKTPMDWKVIDKNQIEIKIAGGDSEKFVINVDTNCIELITHNPKMPLWYTMDVLKRIVE